MSERVIPLVDQRIASLAAPVPAQLIVADGLLSDALGRPLNDLRISVTDRCNFRCNYCMPKEVFDKDHAYLPHNALLSFEEITRLARLFMAHGVRKIRLTGGEPLLRKNIEVLIEQLAALRTPDGQPLDLTLTTNGSLLARKAKSLKAAGLKRVTVSLDGLDDAVFRAMNDVDFPVADVLEGIEAARAAGLGSGEPGHSLKINMVVKRGTNDHEILPMARHFRGTGTTLRFIEYMDVGATNGWRMDEVLPSADVVKMIRAELPLVQLEPSATGETAERWERDDLGRVIAHTDPAGRGLRDAAHVVRADDRRVTHTFAARDARAHAVALAARLRRARSGVDVRADRGANAAEVEFEFHGGNPWVGGWAVGWSASATVPASPEFVHWTIAPLVPRTLWRKCPIPS